MNTSSVPSTDPNLPYFRQDGKERDPLTGAQLNDIYPQDNDPIASDKKILLNMSQHLQIPVIFKRQKAWQHVNNQGVNLIKSSINKGDMPAHSLVVWCESNLPVWRYTGGRVIPNTNVGYTIHTRHLELQQCTNMLYINGSDFRGNISTLRMLLELMICTYPILEHVYGMNIHELTPKHGII